MVALTGAPLANPERLDRMGAALRHRGPDGTGRVSHADAAILVHRLRVIDLDPRADQPFRDVADAVWLCVNGEIYNAAALRRRFPDYAFRSRSDAEVILPMYLRHGAEAIAELEGMFALAIWDARSRQLLLARDRAGEKPLYYAAVGREVWFASEIPALLGAGVSRDLDDVALADYLAWGYVREPRTMFRHVRQVGAGTIHTLSESGACGRTYWTPPASADDAITPRDAVTRLSEVLPAAVSRQTVADVPVGVFLSGGVDSSIVAALATRALGADRVQTFAVGFTDPSYDERPWAARIARQMGVRHTDVLAGPAGLAAALDAMTAHMAEPLADPALLPTWLLARAARERVTVVLGGEGADELFAGYPTYQGHRVAERWQRLPAPLRSSLRRIIAALPVSHRKVSVPFLLRRFVAGADLPWAARHQAWFGTGLPADVGPMARPPVAGDADPVRAARLFDLRSYLRDDLLVKIDRATMAVGLEARAPYLDREVMELALTLPTPLLLSGTTGKWVLREAARAWLPSPVTRRTKRGLSVPVSGWINTALAAEADRLLEPARLSRQGVLRHLSVSRLVAEHRAGRADHGRALWALVMLQRWFEQFGGMA